MKMTFLLLRPVFRVIGFVVTCLVMIVAVPMLAWEVWKQRRL